MPAFSMICISFTWLYFGQVKTEMKVILTVSTEKIHTNTGEVNG